MPVTDSEIGAYVDSLSDIGTPASGDELLIYDVSTTTTKKVQASALGGTVADILDLPTAETDDTLVLAPDGAGGVEFRAEAGGGGGGALVFLEAHAASASAQLDFTSFISSTYDEYLIEIVDLHLATNNVNLLMRVGTGGGPTYDTGSNYAWSSFRWSSSGQAGGGSAGTTSFGLDGSGGIIANANHGVSGQFRLFNPQSATYKRILGGLSYTDASSAPLTSQMSGSYLSATALTAIRFLASSGNITDGTVRIYGVTKS